LIFLSVSSARYEASNVTLGKSEEGIGRGLL